MRYNPRNRNERTFSEPRSTGRWFDERRRDKPRDPCGFHIFEKEPHP